jgi:hypothetical protein
MAVLDQNLSLKMKKKIIHIEEGTGMETDQHGVRLMYHILDFVISLINRTVVINIFGRTFTDECNLTSCSKYACIKT